MENHLNGKSRFNLSTFEKRLGFSSANCPFYSAPFWLSQILKPFL
jgi:hypothetical protein